MKTTTVSILAAAALLACGGGSGGGAPDTTASSLTLDVTAATGLALPQATVRVKCAQGDETSGNITTDANGAASIQIPNGVLPCLIQVTSTVAGDEEGETQTIILHSVAAAESATTTGSTTAARANVTPLTEMIVAQMVGAMPADQFEAFSENVASGIKADNIETAKTAVVNALKDATGNEVDFSTLPDPFTAVLVPATAANPGGGDALDKMLDKLGEKIPAKSIALIVQQLVEAKTADTSNTEAPTLLSVMANVDRGYLAGCPSAVSGKYRTIDYWGRTMVRDIDFKNMKFNRGDGQPLFDITADADQPCQFKVTGTFEGTQAEFDVIIGPQGAGTYRSKNLTTGGSTIGYIFPAQAHTIAELAGTWSFLQSGYLPGVGLIHEAGKITLNADNSVTMCDYNPDANWACEVEAEQEQVVAGPNGSFGLKAAGDTDEEMVPFYAYRSPNGTLSLFGTTNPTGATGVDVEQTHFVAAKLQPLTLPQVGTVTRYVDATMQRVMVGGVPQTQNLYAADANKVTSVDSAAGTFARERLSDGRPDTLKINSPIEGVRERDATTWNDGGVTRNISGMYLVPLPKLGMGVVFSDGTGGHFYNISVLRPARAGE